MTFTLLANQCVQKDDFYTVYMHAEFSPYVSVGEKVSTGQKLMRMGCTGNCTGTHLHFSLWKGAPWQEKSFTVNPELDEYLSSLAP